MAIWGVLVEKESNINPQFNNRYYVEASGSADALSKGDELAQEEITIFGDTVLFTNVHVWRPGVTPNQFDNFPIGYQGSISANTPMASFLCARLTWGVANSYPCFKNYRVHLNSGSYSGVVFATAYQTILNAFAVSMAQFTYLRTLGGLTMGAPVADNRYHNQQEGKRWYNRAP